MPLSGIETTISKGGLGRSISLRDSVLYLCTANAVRGTFNLNQGYRITTLSGLDDLGITEANNGKLYRQVKAFYEITGSGKSLTIIGVSATAEHSDILSGTMDLTASPPHGILKSELDKQGGRITLVGYHHKVSSEPLSEGFPGGIHDAATELNTLADAYRQNRTPFFALLGGDELVFSGLKDYSTSDLGNVSLLISSVDSNQTKEASVGFTAGYLAGLPVQRLLGRVKNGSLPVTNAYYTDGTNIEESADRFLTTINNRYLFVRIHQGRSGYYFEQAPTLTSESSDFSSIAYNRTFNKAIRIAGETLTNEVGDEVTLDADGTLGSINASYYTRILEDAIGINMVASGELSGVVASIDPEQTPIRSGSKIFIVLRVQPVGYSTFISLDIGFTANLITP